MTTRSRACIAALCLVVGAAPATGQDGAGLIWGTVTDQLGGVLPGATVTVRHAATGLTRSDITDQLGEYDIARLSPRATTT